MKKIPEVGRPAADMPSRRAVLRRGAAAIGAAALTLRYPSALAAADTTIRVGWVAALSGPGSQFGAAVNFVKDQLDKVFRGGLTVGGKPYSVEVIVRDSQSSINVASRVAIELMTRDRVDMIVATDALAAIGGGEMAVMNRVPMISTLFPSDALVALRGGANAYARNNTAWTFNFMFDTGDICDTYLGMWKPLRAKLNDQVGTFYVDQPAARGFADPQHGFPAYLAKAGYKTVEGGLFKVETDDFSSQVAKFQAAQAQTVTGFMFPNHFAAFWRKAAQSGYKPQVVTVAGAFLFPGGVDALGDRGDGMSTEIWWTPKLPFASSLTGQSAQALASAWEQSQGAQWTPALGYTHAAWEVAVHALRASGDPRDRESVRSALAHTRIDTVVGRVDFAGSGQPGIAKTVLVGGQWRRARTGKYRYDLAVTYAPPSSSFKVEDELKLLSQLA
ncbi:ABC transporter substrate-binding protein [Paraburkholderia ferrariae]|uniref:ABC transporter substrate-binding protein n=1 Tax=Paraburkholderia ferrariae TaxID=386056 RepID=UPI0005A845BB|nr:ABC transporter substrate-binding protein [Paraburkholderia ferrariae]